MYCTMEVPEEVLDRVSAQAAKMRGVSFDLFHNTGCIFTSFT